MFLFTCNVTIYWVNNDVILTQYCVNIGPIVSFWLCNSEVLFLKMQSKRSMQLTSGIPPKQYENKAKARALYKANPKKKKASVRDSYKADPEMKKASVRDSYKADIESKRSAKRWRYEEDPKENRAAQRRRYEEPRGEPCC